MESRSKAELDLTEIWERDDPFLYLERRAYLEVIQQAWGGIEEARVVLVKAVHRLQGYPGGCRAAEDPDTEKK